MNFTKMAEMKTNVVKLRSPTDWALLRKLFQQGTLKVSEIAALAGVSKTTVYARIKREDWVRSEQVEGFQSADHCEQKQTKTSAAICEQDRDREKMVKRLFSAFENQLKNVEERFTQTSASDPASEKDARTLGTLARTLEKLIALETEERGEKHDEKEDIDQLRQRLAARLGKISERRDTQ